MRVTTHTPSDARAVTGAPHDGDGPWPFLLLHGEGDTTYADTATELVGALIPGYDDIPSDPDTATDADHDEALWLRYGQAVVTAGILQEGLLAAAVNAGDVDVVDFGEDNLNILLGDKAVPFTGEVWSEQVPLCLISIHYAPFTDRPQPAGRVVYVDPSTETAYLTSLHDIGLVQFYQHQPA